jgi:class 3 adenylate cyclase/tetratricopeptide (TPR) repeat protein
MKCHGCGHENASTQKFCGECGTRLEVVCAACQTANTPGQKFCGECGASLVASEPAGAAVTPPPRGAERFASPDAYTPKHLADKILTSRGAVEGERKIVTVMFADVSGFTSMSERLDPEDVHDIMDEAFDVILAAVHQYEGTINQFLGDGVMALFGAPIAHEDHAHRALSAALDVQKALVPLAEKVHGRHGIDFKMRMGINTGLVVVGAIGRDLRMDYTAVGDTTNLAARLLALATPGQIVISERTHHLCDRFFTFDDLGEHTLKGKREPVRAYAVTGAIQRHTRLEVSKARGLTPLVGREAELKRLAEVYERTVAGRGSVVLVVGDPGAGKSRLLYELLSRLDTRAVLELETICASYGRAIAYRPVLELLRRYLGLTEGARPEEVRGRAAERLEMLDLGGNERLLLLAHFLGVPAPAELLNRLSAAELKDRTLDVLRDVFRRASDFAPVVLVVENVHWTDASSLEFLAHLVRSIPEHRILLALSARPGFTVPWLTAETAETISLRVLDPGDIKGMIASLLGGTAVSEALFTLLLDKGGGNPLYVEELVLQLRETGGIVVGDDGEARLGGADVKVPATIQDIIAARVDRLTDTLKLPLQGAAVIGRRFGVPLVSRVIEVEPDDADRRLRELHGSDFVFPSAQDPELMYSFKHALTQDVVYAGLLERRRRQYHRAAGLGLEQLYPQRRDEVVELLAYHFGRSGDDEKAVDYAVAAAEKAQRRWANPEALGYFEDAVKRLAAMPDTPANRLRRIDAVVKQAELMFALGRHAEHVQALTAIAGVVEETADLPRRAAWYYWTGFLHSLTGAPPDVSIKYCQTAVHIAEAAGLEELWAPANSCLGHVYAYAGRLREALEAGERALAAFERLGNVWWTCRTLWGLSLTAIPMGDWVRSLEYCRRALAHGVAVSDRRLIVVGWWRSGWTHIQRGDALKGIECCEKALALSPSPFDAAMARASMGYGLVKAGKIGEGIALLKDAVDWFDRSHLAFTRTWYAIWLADSHIRNGDCGSARVLAEEALAKSRAAGYRYFEGLAQRLLGTALVEDDPPAAAQHLQAALDILEPAGVRNDVAKILTAQAALRRAQGDAAEARALLERALAIFQELGTIDEPPRVLALLAA